MHDKRGSETLEASNKIIDSSKEIAPYGNIRVGRIFYRGVNSGFSKGWPKGFFLGGDNSGEMSCYQFETKI